MNLDFDDLTLTLIFLICVILFSLSFPWISSLFSTKKAKKTREPMTNDNYEIEEIDDFLTSQECELITQLSGDKLFKSRVYSATADVESNVRDSEQCWLKNDSHELIQKISERVAAITETKIEDQEELQVVKYKPGGYYRPHYDACDWRNENCDRFNADKGPRFITFIIYLNDDFEGGETLFPNINKKIIPKRGKAAIFYDTDENGQVLDKALHGGMDVSNGTKWICNKWIRRKTPDQSV